MQPSWQTGTASNAAALRQQLPVPFAVVDILVGRIGDQVLDVAHEALVGFHFAQGSELLLQAAALGGGAGPGGAGRAAAMIAGAGLVVEKRGVAVVGNRAGEPDGAVLPGGGAGLGGGVRRI